jgi:hypothetical protein
MAHTGGIVTAAACCLALAMGALVLSRLVFVKEIGFGVAFAVILDATLVRAVLVPAVMKLLGSAAWWNPFSRRPVLLASFRYSARTHRPSVPVAVSSADRPGGAVMTGASDPSSTQPPVSGSSTPPWPRTAMVSWSASPGAACPVV